jgi:hypothetical protein
MHLFALKKKIAFEIIVKTLTCAIALFEFAFKCFEKVCKQNNGASTNVREYFIFP